MTLVALFGATGGTGRRLLDQARGRGWSVAALARDPSALDADASVRVVCGDVHDPAAVARVVAGADVVVSALGIGMRTHSTTVYSAGTATVLAAAADAGVTRALVVSTSSLEPPSPARFGEWLVCRCLLHPLLRKPYADMRAMERTVRASTSDWTLVRPARLTDGPLTGRYRTAADRKLRGCWSISRADLARFLLDSVDDADTHRRVVEIAY